MEGIFIGGSLLAAFLAGAVALFAPCCIVFMFPAYLAAAVRNSKWRLVPLTLVFAAGLAVVLVPVTLGVGMLARPLLRYHGVVYGFGGILLVVMAAMAVTGKTWPLPLLRGSPDLQRTDSAGVFALGVFSGAASTCCAPVLVGVVTLSAVSPGIPESIAIGMAYVFGMVFPLLVVTVMWDRSKLAKNGVFRGRQIRWSLLGRTFTTNSVSAYAGLAMGLMGIALLVISATGATIAPTIQVGIGTWIENRLRPLVTWLNPVPDWLIAVALVLIAVGALAISGRRRPPSGQSVDEERNCHVESDDLPALAGGQHSGE